MLSDTRIRKAAPKDRPYKVSDGGGLHLYITPAGGKIWRLKYRYGGKEKLLTFGRYPDVGLAAARGKRDKAKAALSKGCDPGVEKKEQEAAAAMAASNTFEKIAREWYDLNKGQWTETHANDVIHSLERDVFPEIGEMPIHTIKAPVVLEVLRKIEKRGAIETAHRVRQRISAVFVYAIAAGIAEDDPAVTVNGALKPVVRRRRQPAITDLEKARQILRDVESTPAHPVTILGHRLLALTAVRIGTLRRTPWVEFDGSDLWQIPSERMKLERKHKGDETRDFLVPLSSQAQEVIEVLRTLTGRGPLVFPSARHAHRPMSENAIGYLLNRAGYYSRHVPHGWRSTFSTVMNERFREDRKIIDLMLAHVPKDKVEGAYNRAAYLDRRRELAHLWADMLMDGMPPARSLLNGPRR